MGLDAGDVVRGSDTFGFFRGLNTDKSAGKRNVPINDLVSYLNDPTILDNVGGGGGGEQVDIDRLEKDAGLSSLRSGRNGAWTWFNNIDGVTDVFADETAVNTGGATNANYNSANDYYSTGTATPANILLHFDGTDASTSFPDATGNHTVTPNGDAQVDTAQSVFGGASGLFDGTGDYLSVPNSTDFLFGSGDFTVDMRVRLNNIIGADAFAGVFDFGTNQRSWAFQTNGSALEFLISTDGTNQVVAMSATISASTWIHVAVVRSGSDWAMYFDGVSVDTYTSSDALHASTASLTIGSLTGGSNPINGHIDEFRLAKGTAVWTSGFTPPASAYSLTTQNMVLPSIDFSTASTPATARAVVLYDPIDAVTLNTDMILELSRDGGTTWTSATLDADAVFLGDIETLTTASIDISAQPVGSNSVRWRLTTANAKEIKVYGVNLKWKS